MALPVEQIRGNCVCVNRVMCANSKIEIDSNYKRLDTFDLMRI